MTIQQFIGNTLVRLEETGEMADIGRRLVEGDATLGWGGEPTLSLHLAVEVGPDGNPLPSGKCHYEVWGRDNVGTPYLALTWPRCDASLLRRLVEIDNRVTSVAERSEKIRAAAQRQREREVAERLGPVVEKAAWALQKDLGAHIGGTTKTYH